MNESLAVYSYIYIIYKENEYLQYVVYCRDHKIFKICSRHSKCTYDPYHFERDLN